MEGLVTTTLWLALEVVERADLLSHRADANQDYIQDTLSALSRVRTLLKDQQEVGIRYNEYYLELLQDIIELCNEASVLIETHINRNWMLQYFHSKNTTIELKRISTALHSRVDMLHNCVSESLHSLVQEYYQIVMNPDDALAPTIASNFSTAMSGDISATTGQQNSQVNDVRYLKSLRRQTRVLSVLLPHQLTIEEAQPGMEQDETSSSIEQELSQVKGRLSELEDRFNRDSLRIDSELVDEMVSLQHRALDLMKLLHEQEKVVENEMERTNDSQKLALPTGNVHDIDDGLANHEVVIIAADVVGSSTVNETTKHTVYNLEVMNSAGQQWRISRRFNDFYLLDIQLRKLASEKGNISTLTTESQLPKLPPKTLYNMSEAVVTARLEGLHQYVSLIQQHHPALLQSTPFSAFLQPSTAAINRSNPF